MIFVLPTSLHPDKTIGTWRVVSCSSEAPVRNCFSYQPEAPARNGVLSYQRGIGRPAVWHLRTVRKL
jgi:hypothetical protein